jgi:ABC-type branched-subunit amino acid transport system substrate-binding protein
VSRTRPGLALPLVSLAALATVSIADVACKGVLGIDTGRYLAEGGAGVCQGTIRVRVLYDITGPTRDVGNDTGKGIVDVLRATNDGGGIRGCTLDLDVADTKYDVPTTIAAYDAWRARPEWTDVSAVFVQGTPMTQAIAPRAADARKLVVTSSYSGEFGSPLPVSHDVAVPSLSSSFALGSVPVTKKSPGHPFAFFQATDYSTSARIAVSHAWRQGAKRVGFFYCSTSAFCADPVDGAKVFLKGLGGTEIGRDLTIELTDDDPTIAAKVLAFFQEELAHKTADPSYEIVDWVWFGNTRASLASAGKALRAAEQQLGVHVSVITNTYGLDESLYAACGDACVGFLGVQAFPAWGDPSAPGMPTLQAVHAKYRAVDGEDPNAHRTVDYVAGYVTAAAWRLAVTAAVDAGQSVTGQSVRDAFERFRDQPVDGFAALTYTPSDHRPQGTARVYRLGTTGALEVVGQPLSIQLSADWLGW